MRKDADSDEDLDAIDRATGEVREETYWPAQKTRSALSCLNLDGKFKQVNNQSWAFGACGIAV